MGPAPFAGIHSRRDCSARSGTPGVGRSLRNGMIPAVPRRNATPLQLLSVVIPALNEEGCICSTVEHLTVELRIHGVPNEIIVVDDGSTDSTWCKLQELSERLPNLRPLRNC